MRGETRLNEPAARIQHRCPQCGAPAELIESDRWLRCAYCRVSSCIVPGDVVRYLLGAPRAVDDGGAGRDDRLIWFPYWRLRGTILLLTHDGGISYRHVDATIAALGVPAFPAGLGVRPEAMPLRFVSPETPGRFIRAGVTSGEAMRVFARRFAADTTAERHDFIGESLSLIYAPYRVGLPGAPRGLADLLTGHPAGGELDPDTEATLPAEPAPPAGVNFIPAICPRCGGSLDGERAAVAFRCAPCGVSWSAGPRGFEAIEEAHLDDDIAAPVFLPFWCFDAGGHAYWTPAMKLRPPVFFRLAASLTLRPPDHLASGAPPPAHGTAASDGAASFVVPTLGPDEAAASAVWVAAFLHGSPRGLLTALGSLQSRGAQAPLRPRLVRVPFSKATLQYENAARELAIEQSAVSMGKEM